MRRRNNEDMSKLLTENEQRGFPLMLDSTDCIH